MKCDHYSFSTPVDRSPEQLCNGVEIMIKRDDLFPMVGGGNKGRKAQYIVRMALKKGYTALVTNGGVQSNHARAMALSAAENGLFTSLILHDEHFSGGGHKCAGNLMIMAQAGAKITFCTKSQLSQEMDLEMQRLRDAGHLPLYVWGGGHCLEGTQAYVDAVFEFRCQMHGEWIPDYVILASGTGTTQAGLHVGFSDSPTRVLGISVARDAARGQRVVADAISEYCRCSGKKTLEKQVDFRDEWIEGGYEAGSERLYRCIDRCAKYGLILDPTYTGKAWLALEEMVKNGEIAVGRKVLFWHTGGLLNLMSSQEYLSRRV